MVVLRMIRGFSNGGEYCCAATFMAEYAPSRRRSFLGSFLEFGTLAGFSLGALLMLAFSVLLNDDQMGSWGWRLPFMVAAPLGLVGVYLRSKLEDTPVFRELEQSRETEQGTVTQFKDLIGQYWAPILQLVGLVVALNVVNYALLTYMPTYLDRTIGLSICQALVVPVIGMVSMMAATFPAMFPTQVRYAGFAIAYNVSTSLFGRTAPLVNDWLVSVTGVHLVPAYYMMAACVIGAISLIKVTETARCPIGGTEIPGTPEAPPQLDYDIDTTAQALVDR
jgi:MFS transporter, MHS family, proline/betaine transporter